MLPKFLAPSLFFTSLPVLGHASVISFNPATCVDPAGMKSCFARATSLANECFAQNCNDGECVSEFNCFSGDPFCTQNCVCIAYRDWINCALSHCWNEVYSCAHQSLVVQAFMNCEIATRFPPYFPPPADAPGGCSCNIGGVYKAVRYYWNDGIDCNEYIDDISGQLQNGLPLKYHDECDCCALSAELSAFPNICPDTDPASFPFWANVAVLAGASSTYPRCSNIMATATCTADPIGFPTPVLAPQGQFYLPGEIPAPGSDPASDLPGGLKHPVSGAVITWSLAASALTAVATAVTRA